MTVKMPDSIQRGKGLDKTTEGSSMSNNSGPFLTKYFLVILFLFAFFSLILNSRFTHLVVQDASVLETHLKGSVQILTGDFPETPPLHQSKNAAGPSSTLDFVPANPHSNLMAGLNCEKFGGPDREAAQEMVYWEDIPSDALWISPFNPKMRPGIQTQYLTFEPDQGGWNNIR